MTCKHTKIQTWADAETSEPVDLWSCADCGRKFAPVEVGRDCRTCANSYMNMYDNPACLTALDCTNGSEYEPLPPVRLYRTAP